jgi:hypothetical protein
MALAFEFGPVGFLSTRCCCECCDCVCDCDCEIIRRSAAAAIAARMSEGALPPAAVTELNDRFRFLPLPRPLLV